MYSIGANIEKIKIAIGLRDENGIISINVLNEFVNVSRRKLLRSIELIREDINYYLSLLTLIIPGFETFERALEIGSATGYSHFDSMVLSAALESGCSIFYTEDLQH